MPPGSQPSVHRALAGHNAHSRHAAAMIARAAWLSACAMPALIIAVEPAFAQDRVSPSPDFFWTDGKDPNASPEGEFLIPAAEDENAIAFEAGEIDYDADNDVITASGDVVLRRGDQQLTAQSIRWDRKSGQIMAEGDIRLRDAGGNVLYTDRLELNDELRAGAMENMLLVMNEGARMAARTGDRDDDGFVQLRDVAYSPCAIEGHDGCPRSPSWRITARRVKYNPDTQMVRFVGARLELFGAPLVPLPGLRVRADDKPLSGFTTPNLRFSASNGVEVMGEYYWRLADNRELTLGTSIYTDVVPMASARYAALTEDGAYQVTGYATNSSRIPIGGAIDATPTSERDFRGYLDGNGRFQLSDNWSITGSIRVASDRTFLRRYDISRDDRLRSMVQVERVDDTSYLAITGWATQTLRTGEDQGLVPFALPLVDYRRRVADPLLGGNLVLQANSLMLERSDGQDTQRAFASATWNLHKLTGMGQEVLFTGLARGDVYHSDNNALTSVDLYRGEAGWQGRAVAMGAMDIKWPFVGQFLGGTQVFTPRVQFVASPQIRNLKIPNEDARAVDLEDSNLFALNRFPGYDRIEDGTRMTYGFDWRWSAPGWRISTTLGQSYRLSSEPELLPDGTGLTSRTSDIVGRGEVRWRDFVSFTHRFRLDKDGLAPRRSESDVTVGTRTTYVQAGYLKLNRNIPATLEDLRDREELRLAGRVAFANYWSMFGSTVINLTDRAEDPSLTSDGFEPLRTRIGLSYDDDCLSIALTWRRDSFTTGDARKGSTVLFRFRLKNLGL